MAWRKLFGQMRAVVVKKQIYIEPGLGKTLSPLPSAAEAKKNRRPEWFALEVYARKQRVALPETQVVKIECGVRLNEAGTPPSKRSGS